MKRRALLCSLSAGAVAATGCLSRDSGTQPTDTDGPTETATPVGGDAPTDTLNETPDSDPSATPSGVAEQSLAVTDSGCGGQTNEASVAFGGNPGTVAVAGTTWGSDSCSTAVLSDVRLDGGTLTVVVAAESDAGTDTLCAECLTEVDYEATVRLDGALPATVTVVHERDGGRTQVTSVER